MNCIYLRTLAVLFPIILSLSAIQADDTRPNIILILCDDLGYADVGFNGSKDILTPELDRLAKAGTTFESAYVVHPFCGPSRMGMMAERYPHEFGVPYNLPNSGQGFEEYNRKGIPVNETMFSTVLQDAGYATGAVGKWHMGYDSQFHPNARGFDDFYGFLGGGHEYFPEKYAPTYERQRKAGKELFNDYIVPLQHNGEEVQETEYMTDALSRESARFIEEASSTDKPFFLYVAYNAPHTPLQAKEEDEARFASIQDEKSRTYAAMVYAVDRGVGRIVETLKQTNELHETLIVFLSDNGGNVGARRDHWKACCIGKRWQLYDLNEDIGETKDIREQHPDVLQAIITATKRWSQEHVQPEWFDNEQAEERWKSNGMPNHDALFPNN